MGSGQAPFLAREQRKRLETIASYAQDMSEFLKENELTERRAFIEPFVKEIVVMPGRNAEEMALNGSVLSTVKSGGRAGTRTPDLADVNRAL